MGVGWVSDVIMVLFCRDLQSGASVEHAVVPHDPAFVAFVRSPSSTANIRSLVNPENILWLSLLTGDN
jgi:hypothetical protein